MDTSALVDGWGRYYPPSVFPALWDRIDRLIQEGMLLASKEVLRELERKADDLYDWCCEREEMFVEIDDAVQIQVAVIMAKYPKLVDTRTGKSSADPFVIAFAQTQNPQLAVVTGEQGGSLNRPKIPFVCQEENIRCLSLLEMIQEQGWTF